MKFKTAIFTLLFVFVGICAFRAPLEAKTHFSLNLGAVFAPRPVCPTCVVERYPVYAEPVYVVPAPRVYVAPQPYHEVHYYRAPCPFCH